MTRILFQTQKGYNIREGKQYLVITKDGEGVEEAYSLRELTATGHEPNGVVERWFDNVQASSSLERLQADALVRVTELKARIEEEKLRLEEEEKARRGSLLEQLMKVTSDKEFQEFLKLNKLTLTVTSTKIDILNEDKIPLFTLTCGIKDTPYCCGSREHGSHDGHYNITLFPVTNDDKQINQLVKYITPLYDNQITGDYKGLFITTFIVRPGSTGFSSIWGKIFENSQYFDVLQYFKNKNTDNNLLIYTTNELFNDLYDESDSDEDSDNYDSEVEEDREEFENA